MKNTLDYILGIHSNIPECCVRYFCKNRERIVSLNLKRHRKDPSFLLEWGKSVQYVMCPKCYIGFKKKEVVPNKLHKCTKNRNDPICKYFTNCWNVDFDTRLAILCKELGIEIKC